MQYLLFLFYFTTLCWLVPKIPFVKQTGLSRQLIVGLFVIKVIVGIFLGWITQKYAPNSNDYFGNQLLSVEEHSLLMSNPKEFFVGITKSTYSNYSDFFGSLNSYWNDLKVYIVIKLAAIFNIFSGSNYYINSIFFSTIAFIGHAALYRIFIHIYPLKKWAVVIGCFLLPSTLYFTSGVHKDPLVFMFTGIYCYCLYFMLYAPSLKKIVLLVFSLAFILVIRSYVAILLVPSSIAYLICVKCKTSAWLTFVGTYAVSLLLVMCVQFIKPSFKPLSFLSNKQEAFYSLAVASSQLPSDTLQPTVSNFVRYTPKALNHAILRPYILEFKSPFLNLFALEMTAYLLCICLALISNFKQIFTTNPFNIFSIFLLFSVLLVIGYIVPNAGSIVRYRSLFLPFMVTPVLCGLPTRWLNIKFKNIY